MPTTKQSFVGAIGNVRIFDTARSPAQIAADGVSPTKHGPRGAHGLTVTFGRGPNQPGHTSTSHVSQSSADLTWHRARGGARPAGYMLYRDETFAPSLDGAPEDETLNETRSRGDARVGIDLMLPVSHRVNGRLGRGGKPQPADETQPAPRLAVGTRSFSRGPISAWSNVSWPAARAVNVNDQFPVTTGCYTGWDNSKGRVTAYRSPHSITTDWGGSAQQGRPGRTAIDYFTERIDKDPRRGAYGMRTSSGGRNDRDRDPEPISIEQSTSSQHEPAST